jgi:putative ABC transport system ATP-binding protein
VVELLAGLSSQLGLGILMVTHDSRLASWADRVLVLRDGRVLDEVAPPAPSAPGAPGAAGAGSGTGSGTVAP